jgi:hypothetical protein
MVARWQCPSREEGAKASYIGKRTCRGGASLRREGIQALMPCTAVTSVGACAQGGTAGGPAGERGARPTASAGNPRGGAAHPEGCGARTDGRGPASRPEA